MGKKRAAYGIPSLWVGVILLLSSTLVTAEINNTLSHSLSSASHSRPQWVTVANGILFSMIEAYRYCRRGAADIAVIRIEPEAVRIQAHYFRATENQQPMTVAQWQRLTGSVVVFNGSQYYPDLRPMGWFIQDGKNLGTPQVKGWKGLLAAHPTRPGLSAVTVIDLEKYPYTLQTLPFSVAVQSLMLFDDLGTVRTRKSGWIANRTVVGEDKQGRILVICTQGGYTLWEMAQLLQEGILGIRRAMVLDGGLETQLAVRSNRFSCLLYGQWSIGDSGDRSIPGIHKPIPSVITIDSSLQDASEHHQSSN